MYSFSQTRCLVAEATKIFANEHKTHHFVGRKKALAPVRSRRNFTERKTTFSSWAGKKKNESGLAEKGCEGGWGCLV